MGIISKQHSIGLILAVCLFASSELSNGNRAPNPYDTLKAGDALYEQGHLEEAIRNWKEAGRQFARNKEEDLQLESLLRQISGCHEIGQHKLALSLLRDAFELLGQVRNPQAAIKLKALQGLVCSFSREAGEAERYFRESLKEARECRDRHLSALILNNLGVMLSSRGDTADATACFQEVIAGSENQPMLLAKAYKNLADISFQLGEWQEAKSRIERALKIVHTLPNSHEKGGLLLGLGQQFQRLFVDGAEHKNEWRLRAFEAQQAAYQVAKSLGDERLLAYVLGEQAGLYEFEKRFHEALSLSRSALVIAQRLQLVDLIYRCQWQIGRILNKQDDKDAAINAYQMAVFSLQAVRNDVAIRYGNKNARSSFREAVGDLYLELSDLLLQKAATESDRKKEQLLLVEARESAEMLKSAELEDYFQDDCVNLLQSKKRKIDSLSKTALVVYIIPLPNRTEVLLSLPGGELDRISLSITEDELLNTVRRFRVHLEDRTTNEYLSEAQELYAALIKPVEVYMDKYHCDTMVFVPDSALRTIPMSAFHDGERFLIEKYAVAVTPGLELMDSASLSNQKGGVMISGLSESVQGFPALNHVPEELGNLGKLYPQSNPIKDQGFQRTVISDKLLKEGYSIVHIASHGHFDQDIRKSFILTHDSKLSLDDLERCIRPAQLRDQPLEMLALSACQTAAGDDRAALGLAGVAVKAGARSAFATLWFVNDQASTELVSEFYNQIVTSTDRNKAKALQAAQQKLLKQERYHHPCYWAPYLVIGNWM